MDSIKSRSLEEPNLNFLFSQKGVLVLWIKGRNPEPFKSTQTHPTTVDDHVSVQEGPSVNLQ